MLRSVSTCRKSITSNPATIGLLQERSTRRSDTLSEQLQGALNSRVVIEQAKGKLAERLGVDMDQAFALLRDRARATNRRLSDLAQARLGSRVKTWSISLTLLGTADKSGQRG